MNHSDMLQRMCHAVLANGDLKAIVKSRGFPQSATNPGILTGLFLTEQGLANAFKLLNRQEIGALHLLKAVGKPVDISFFERVYEVPRLYHPTFTQKYQSVLAKVKERLVRTGVLLMSDVSSFGDHTKMELWRFGLPVQFHPHLPPLFESLRQFEGPGDHRSDVLREKLTTDLSQPPAAVPAKKDGLLGFQIADGELRLGESRFKVARLADLQFALWKQQLTPPKKSSVSQDANYLEPPQAVYQLLTSLGENQWVEPEQLDDFAQVSVGQKVDCRAVCEAGWQVGMLAKLEADGKSWYRPAPAEPVLAPHKYLEVIDQDQCVSVDLTVIPHRALETLVHLGNVRPHPSGSPSLLLTPNLLWIGRAHQDMLASDEANWLFHHSRAFAQAHDTLVSRKGKTIVHSNVLIARVTDLSLKVALEKLLGENWVALKNDYVVFPRGALSEVQRIVKKSGYVIKEVTANER